MKRDPIQGPSIRANGTSTSRKWFVWPALASVALLCWFLCCHLVNLRENTSILCGTSPGTPLAAVLGIAYVGAWLLVMLVAPVLAISALLGWLSSLIMGVLTSTRKQRDVIDS